MASTSFGFNISKTISVVLLTSWTITTLGFSVINVLNESGGLIGRAASISLLTYLACRLLVFAQPDTKNDSIAYFLTTAHLRSPLEALATFMFTCAWLYELLSKAVTMMLMTFLGGTIATLIYTDSLVEVTKDQDPMTQSNSDLENTSLAQIDEFKAKSGLDPVALSKLIAPQLLISFAVLVWVNFGALGLYVLRLSWRSAKAVLGSPSFPVAQKTEASDLQ